MKKWICMEDLQQMTSLLNVCEIIVCIMAVIVPSAMLLLGSAISVEVKMLLYIVLSELLALTCIFAAICKDNGGLRLYLFLHIIAALTAISFLL